MARPYPALFLLVWLWGWLVALPPAARAGVPVAEGLRFKRLTTAEGLSENSAYCLLQDRRGYLWAGSQDGLNRYDGTGFRVFKAEPQDTTALGSGFILALAEGADGALWVGTGGGGLSRYDPATEQFHTFRAGRRPTQLAHNFVRAVLVDRRGRVWAGTDNGLCRYDPRTASFRTYRYAGPVAARLANRLNQVRAIAQGPDGRLWVGTGAGQLAWVDERRGVLVPAWQPESLEVNDAAAAPDVGQHAITTLLFDQRWRLWIGTEGDGLRAWEPATNRLRTYRPDAARPGAVASAAIHDLLRDRAGVLWVATADGLSRYDALHDTFRTWHHNPGFPTTSLPDDGVQAIIQDRTGLLWVATEGGLASFSVEPGAFARVGPASATVWAVAEDQQGGLWMGTEASGVLHLADREGEQEDPDQLRVGPGGLPQAFVRAVYPDRRGHLWVGTQSSGLACYDPRTQAMRLFRHDPNRPGSLSDDYVRSISEDRTGYLWIGTEGGLNRYDPLTGRFQVFRHDPADPTSLPNNYVRQTYEDRQGRLWVATGGGGLALFDTERQGRFTAFRHRPDDPQSLPADFVRTLYQDRAGTLWIGTEGWGLARLDDAHGTGRFTVFNERNGLPSNVVYAILEDDDGFLWLATNRGVARFDPRQGSFRRYDVRDGLLRDEFNAGAYARGHDGRLYFGGPAGLLGFHPDSLRINRVVPPVMITNLRLFNRSMVLDSAIGERRVLRLRPDENFLTFEFAALNYRLPDKNRYAYRLEGLAGDRWIDAGGRHEAAFTNLDPGEYVFRVRAANNDGVWNMTGASVRIIIPPPWYRTWWFRLVLSLLIFGLLWAVYRVRVAQLLALERVRHGIARDLHDDMGSTLSSISILSQVAREHHRQGRAEQVSQLLGQIGDASHRMLDSMDDIVWAINPAHDSLEDVTTRMRTFASDVLEARGIDFTFAVEPAVLDLRLEMRARREFFLLFKEAVNNLAKYARCQNATIALRYENRHLVLRVADDGVGFDLAAPAQGGGNGVTNMRQRASALKSELEIETAPGQGTQLTVRVPM